MSLFKGNDTNFVRSLKAKLVGDDEYLVVARTHQIEISLINKDGSLKHERTIKFEERILDIEHFRVDTGNEGHWLIIAYDNNPTSLRFLAFRTIQDSFIPEDFPLRFRGKEYNIVQNSLREDGFLYFTVWTEERDLLLFRQAGKGFECENFAKAMDPKNTSKLKFFRKPEIIPSNFFIHDNNSEILTWDIIGTEEGDFAYALIRSDKAGKNYSFTNPLWKVKMYESYLRSGWDGKLPGPVQPITLNLDFTGTILFCKSGFYFRHSPYGFEIETKKDAKIQENSTITVQQNGVEGCLAYMNTPAKVWNVVAAAQIGYGYNFIIIEENGDIYSMTFKTLSTGAFDIGISEWTYKKLDGSLPGIIQLIKLKDNVFYATSDSIESYVFTVVDNEKIQIIQEVRSKMCSWKGKPFSSILPKRKMYKYESEIWVVSSRDIWTYDIGAIKLNMNAQMRSIPNLVMDILDVKIINGETLVLTKNSLIKGKKTIKSFSISHGVILENGDLVVVSGRHLTVRDFVMELKCEPSILQASETTSGELHILVGNWDGSVEIFSGKEQHTLRLSSPITAAAIVNLGNAVSYLVGSDNGEVKIFNQNLKKEVQVIMGRGTVDFSNVHGNKVIAFNQVNLVEFAFDDNGEIARKSYLEIPRDQAYPPLVQYDDHGNLLVAMSNESKRPLDLIDYQEVSKYTIP